MNYDVGVVRGRRIISPDETYFAAAAAGAYVGPGDKVASGNWFNWAGLRAFSAATAGTKAINLRRDSDQATQDFNTLTNGNLDVASIATFKGAANVFVTKVYDQTGNGIDYGQVTAANQPGLTLAGLGSLPIMTFSGSQCLFFALGTTLNSVSMSVIALTTDSANVSFILCDDIDIYGMAFVTGIAVDMVAAGNVKASVSATTNVWYAIVGTFNVIGTNSIDVNGTTATDPTLGLFNTSQNVVWGARNTAASGVQSLIGRSNEMGIMSVVATAGQQTDLVNNQRAYWGF